MLRLFKKKILFLQMKIQISSVEDQKAGHGDRLAEARRGSKRHRDGFAGLGGHSAYQEAQEVISRDSRRPCTPFLLE